MLQRKYDLGCLARIVGKGSEKALKRVCAMDKEGNQN